MNTTLFLILAAGKGSRLKTQTPKPLIKACGKSLIDYVIEQAELFQKTHPMDIGVVVGFGEDLVKNHLKDKKELLYATQKELNGTAGAVKAFFSEHDHTKYKNIFIACADTPLIHAHIFEELLSIKEKKSLKAVAATFESANPTGFGRIVRQQEGFFIREEKDASEEEKKIKEVNSGFYFLDCQYLYSQIQTINSNNAAHEFYLTDIFTTQSFCEAFLFNDEIVFQGVNTYDQLSLIEKKLQEQKINQMQKEGVYFENAASVWIDQDVQIGSGTRVGSSCSFYGKTLIGENNSIETGCIFKNSTVGEFNKILAYSYMEEASIGYHNDLGPFARLRPLTVISEHCKIGNFVEVKKSEFKKGAKASHLSYIGDATIGENSNLGCGFITCNYDGKKKHQTTIGNNSFIGSDVQVIAPIDIGDNAFIAAGSTITKSIESGDFAIARSKQTTITQGAKRFLE